MKLLPALLLAPQLISCVDHKHTTVLADPFVDSDLDDASPEPADTGERFDAEPDPPATQDWCLPDTVDQQGDPGSNNTMVMNGTEPIIAYHARSAGDDSQLRLATQTPAGWAVQTLDEGAGYGLASRLDAAVDPDLWIAYSGDSGAVRLAHRAATGTWATSEVVVPGSIGVTSVELALVDGQPVVAIVEGWPNFKLWLWHGGTSTLELVTEGPVFHVDLAVTPEQELRMAYNTETHIRIGQQTAAGWAFTELAAIDLGGLWLTAPRSDGVWLAYAQMPNEPPQSTHSTTILRLDDDGGVSAFTHPDLVGLGFSASAEDPPPFLVRGARDLGGAGILRDGTQSVPPDWITPALVTAAALARAPGEAEHVVFHNYFPGILGYVDSACVPPLP